MAATLIGPHHWDLERDEQTGHRTYTLVMHVRVSHVETLDGDGLVTSRVLDGPQVAATADGLPSVGDGWVMGNEDDPAARCTPYLKADPKLDGEANCDFFLTYKFSTKPLANCQRDGDFPDPLLVPPKISTGTRQDRTEAAFDRFGAPVLSSSHEPLRGHAVEFDRDVKTVRIIYNVPALDEALDAAIGYVNDSPMWGHGPRTVRLLRAVQECKFTGDCDSYVEVTAELEIDPAGQDRWVLDEGSKVIRGKWVNNVYVVDADADPANPQHFVRFFDRNGNNSRVILDGKGAPADVAVFRGALFASLEDANVGHPLSDSAWWLPITGAPSGEDWAAGHGWKAGRIVVHVGHYLIALTDVSPEEDFDPLTQTELWADLGTAPLVDGSFYSEAGLYPRGYYVRGTEIRGPGKRLVSYYLETDLLLAAGLPVTLECQTG